MKRKCFLDNSKAKNFHHENLDLFFFGKKKLIYGICKKCGLIYQSDTVSPIQMKNYYDASIVAFDNLYKPTKDKIKSVNRHINIIKDEIKTFPTSVLEISCLNSHVLKQFKKSGAKIIEGLEPSKIVAQSLRKKENLIIHNTTIEKFKFRKKYDLIILTHVLEHLYNPLLALKKCFNSQSNNQHVLLEVPLFDHIENYPNGSFVLEHLSYFSENNFLSLVEKSGYKPTFVSKTFDSTVFPFITVVGRKILKKNIIINKHKWFENFKGFKNLKVKNFKKRNKKNNDYLNQYKNAKDFVKWNRSLWNAIDKKINKFDKKKPIYIYCAGFHGSQFLYYTSVEKEFKIKGFIDSSEIKKNGTLGKYRIFNPKSNEIDYKANIIICSNYSENTIFKSLKKFRDKGMKTYKLYNPR